MKKLISALVSVFILCSSVSLASVGGMAALKDDINGQLQTANLEIENALAILAERLNQKLDRLDAYEKSYCNTKGENCQNASALTATDETEVKDVIVHKVVGGWVGNDHSIHQVLSEQPNFDFLDIDAQNAIFDKHLCLEVHFKTTSEIKFAKPLYMNKTIVLCAQDAGGDGLINIDLVDSDPTDGGNTTHVKVAEGLAGWRCFNPDSNLGNSGTAFGYDSDGSRVIDKVDGVLNNCLVQKSADLSF